ncbi:MAG TPA: cupin domain-containing protein [Terriglobales bacterium]|nr:cupin domain-containing protein [Terriglobales bacterium]
MRAACFANSASAEKGFPMPFINTNGLTVIERLPGWKGRYFHTNSMTFAHYQFAAGSSIHEHSHPEEEVYEVLEGELEVTIDGSTQIVKPGTVAIVPANSRHSVKALTDGRLIVVDHPARRDFEFAHSAQPRK